MRISRLFFAMMFALVLVLAIADFDVSVPFALSCAAIASSIIAFYRYVAWRGYLLFVNLSLFTVYLLRIPVLYFWPESFSFSDTDPMTREWLISTSYALVVPLALCSWGFAIPLMFNSRLEPDGARDEERHNSVLVQRPNLFLTLFALVLLMRVALAYQFGVGVKLVANKQAGAQFLSQIVPEMACVAFGVMLLMVYRRFLPSSTIVLTALLLAANALATTLFGSKSGVLKVVLAIATILVVKFRDKYISKTALLALSIPLVMLVAISMVVATTMRWASRNESDVRSGIAVGLERLDVGSQIGDGFLATSMRISAFDGFAIADIRSTHSLRDAYDPANVFVNSVARLVPGVPPASMTISKATAYYIYGRDESFGGVLGLFPTLGLMFGEAASISVFVYAVMTTILYSLISRISNRDIRTSVQFFMLFATLRLIMAGAFDQVVPEFVVSVAHSVAIVYVLSFFNNRS